MILTIQNLASNPKTSCKISTDDVMIRGFLYLIKNGTISSNLRGPYKKLKAHLIAIEAAPIF
jgi:hypothetical protein